MNELEAVLKTVRDRIGRYRGQTIGEENTKNVLIELAESARSPGRFKTR